MKNIDLTPDEMTVILTEDIVFRIAEEYVRRVVAGSERTGVRDVVVNVETGCIHVTLGLSPDDVVEGTNG